MSNVCHMPRPKSDGLPPGIYVARRGRDGKPLAYGVDYHDGSGRRRRKIVGPTLKLAEKVRAQVLTEIAEGRYFRRRKMTVAEAIQRFLAGAGAGKRSWRDDRRFATLWTAELGPMDLGDVTAGHVEAVKVRWAQTVATNTVNHRMSFLRRVYSVAMRDHLATSNPVREVRFYRDESAGDTRYLTDQEEVALRAAFPQQHWHIVTFAILTGLRQEEQFTLRWSQVNWDTGRITLTRTKSGKARHVPMHADVVAMLRQLQAAAASEWVFAGRAGRRRDGVAFYRRHFIPAARRAGLEIVTEGKQAGRSRRGITWHTLRHTCASRLVMAGVDLRTVMEIMGHSSLAVTQRYAHLAPQHVTDAINKIRTTPEPTSDS